MKTLRYCRAADTVGQILSCCESCSRLWLEQNYTLFIPAEDQMHRPALVPPLPCRSEQSSP